MVIVLSVTPWSVAPLAVPGPHGEASVPNVVAGAAVEVVAELTAVAAVVAVVALDDPRPLLQAATTSAPIRRTALVRIHPTRPAIGPPPEIPGPNVRPGI